VHDPTHALVKLVLPSRISWLDLAHGAAERAAFAAGFEEEDAFDFGLAVREAAVNAMTHGNRLDPSRPVSLVLLVGEGTVRARVRDRGKGFDPGATADPRRPENLLRTSGRGLLLIRAYVDELSFRFRPGRGMELTLFKRKAAAAADADEGPATSQGRTQR
jgi:serine/threonine-protein kinase RsbW